MSRRFGRNHRRRMREELAAKELAISGLSSAVAMDRALLKAQSAEIDSLKSWMDEVRDMVGRTAVAAGEPIDEGYVLPAGETSYRVGVVPPMQFECSTLEMSMPERASIHVETMRLLQVKVVGDAIRAQTHCMVKLGTGEAAYTISDGALRRMTAEELENRFLPRVAEDLTRLIVRQIVAALGGRVAP